MPPPPPPVVEVKNAVTDAGPLMVRFAGLLVVDKVPLKPENWKPVAAVALMGTTVPALNHPLGGLIVPPVPARVVRKY